MSTSVAAFFVDLRHCIPHSEKATSCCCREHTAIVHAVEHRDPAEAVRLMGARLAEPGEALRDYLDRPVDAARRESARREAVPASHAP